MAMGYKPVLCPPCKKSLYDLSLHPIMSLCFVQLKSSNLSAQGEPRNGTRLCVRPYGQCIRLSSAFGVVVGLKYYFSHEITYTYFTCRVTYLMRDAEYGCIKYATHTWLSSIVTVDGIVTTSCSYCGAGGERINRHKICTMSHVS